ncbi:RNA 3'-terminal phosphate cyclase [Patescibacteria group bacterium]|nr:RNA 3'-terminal phosphate cyclase [Patescibacteria group bacterium]
MIEVDGEYLESGGQILRTAIALSTVTKKPCRVFNIRKNRPKAGLAAQHLLGIQALARLCDGKLEGDYLGSEEIKFYPGDINRDRVSVNISTAGSITLAFQTLILPSLFAPSPIKITFDGGGTDTFFSPSIDHFRHIFLKILEKMDGKVKINIIKRGYYPEGGARVEVRVDPSKIKSLDLIERGQLKKIIAISGASELLKNKKVAERQMAGVREVLGKLKLPLEEKIEYYETSCPGSQICLIAEFENTVIGTDNLGKLGKRAEDVGKEAALELLKEQKSEACLDKHLADQILPYMALASEKSQVTVSEITNHCKTNIWVIEKFLEGRFEIKENSISWVLKI